MTAKIAFWLGLGMLATAVLGSILLYPSLPDMLPIHWGLNGQPNGWAPKGVAVLLMPGTMACLLGLMLALPVLSPRHFEIDRFAPTFHYLMVVVVGLMGYLHGVILEAGRHPDADLGRLLVGGLVLFMGALGNDLGKTRRNFFIGIRTPWTLASESVWIGTHRFAGKVIVATSLVTFAAILAGLPLAACFTVVVLSWLAPVAYSYILYKRIEASEVK